jgi:uncharacterized membrane protein
MKTGVMATGAAAGAGITYFLDPERGARRRARLRDVMVHNAVLTRRAAGATARDAFHRTYGTAASLGHLVRRETVDDAVLVARVRAKLGRVTSHPHAIVVSAGNGIVSLRGPILVHEADGLIQAVRKVRGVSDVRDELERHETAGNIPSLQGGRVPPGVRVDVLQESWSPTTRCMVGTAGGVLALAGGIRRDGAGAILALVGAGAVARAITNLPLRRLVGVGSRRRAVDIQKTIVIEAPVGEVYAFWSAYENFPKFMARVLEVRPAPNDPDRSHWKVMGMAGLPVTFDAETTRVSPNQTIAWRSAPGSVVAHAGIVRFDPEGVGHTRVHIRMSYNPPAGWFGHQVAAAFGMDPKSSMDGDLVRMKTLIETGNAPHDAAQRDRPQA